MTEAPAHMRALAFLVADFWLPFMTFPCAVPWVHAGARSRCSVHTGITTGMYRVRVWLGGCPCGSWDRLCAGTSVHAAGLGCACVHFVSILELSLCPVPPARPAGTRSAQRCDDAQPQGQTPHSIHPFLVSVASRPRCRACYPLRACPARFLYASVAYSPVFLYSHFGVCHPCCASSLEDASGREVRQFLVTPRQPISYSTSSPSTCCSAAFAPEQTPWACPG